MTTTKVSEKDVAAFLTEIVDVCKKHGLSLAHKDIHGAFTVTWYSDEHTKWLCDAENET